MLDDNSDDDIFVIHQLKPVVNLTKRECLLIKNNVLRQAKLDLHGNVLLSKQEPNKAKKTNEKAATPPIKRKSISNESPKPKRLSTKKSEDRYAQNVTPVSSPKKASTSTSPQKSPNKAITDYFSPLKKKQDVSKISVRNDLTYRDIVVNPDILLKKKEIVEYYTDPVELVHIDSSDDEIQGNPTPAKKIEKLNVSPERKTKVQAVNSATSKEENITLSPGIKRNKKKFKSLIGIVGPTKKGKEVKKKLFFVPVSFVERNTKNAEPFKPSTTMLIEQIQHLPDSETLTNDSDRLDADILKFIIQNVIELQMYLKKKAAEANEAFADLITDSEMIILEKYTYLNLDCQTLFMRMFFRKEGWHRVSNIATQYPDLSHNIEGVLRVLNNVKYVKRNINDEDIRVQLRLLKANELSTLGKSFSVGNSSLRKDELLNAIISETKAQRSVLDLFKPTNSSRRLEMIADEAQKCLGPCFQIDDLCRKTINRIILLFSIFHEVESESKRAQHQRFLIFQVLVGSLKFVSFDVVPTVIFFDRYDFIEYENALVARDDMEAALKAKDYPTFCTRAKQSEFTFKAFVSNKSYCERVSSLPTFLRNYNAGSVHAKILTMYCESFKKKTAVLEVVNVLKILLGQTVFNYGYRSKWIEMLCQSYQSLKMMEEAAVLLINALEGDTLDEVIKYSLIVRGQTISKAKKNRLTNDTLKIKLESLCVHSIDEPTSIEIRAQALSGNPMGSKLVYVQNTAMGKCYTSVEEQAILHYKKHGFTEGIHSEGFIVSTIFNIFFFDIIYSSVPGVFQSNYQERPLDMWSSSFYSNRKELIDTRLEEMGFWCSKTISDCIEKIFAQHKDTSSVIVWKDSITPQLLCEIIECIGMPAIVEICKRFAYTPRIARSGFPDLTLWNKVTKTAKFVEVKSPNDRLASNQRLWLQYLRNAGIDCEVCNVRNIGSKFQ